MSIMQGLTEFLKSQKFHARFHSNICTVYGYFDNNPAFIDIIHCCYENKLSLKCYIGNGCAANKCVDLIDPNSLDRLLEIIKETFA